MGEGKTVWGMMVFSRIRGGGGGNFLAQLFEY